MSVCNKNAANLGFYLIYIYIFLTFFNLRN